MDGTRNGLFFRHLIAFVQFLAFAKGGFGGFTISFSSRLLASPLLINMDGNLCVVYSFAEYF